MQFPADQVPSDIYSWQYPQGAYFLGYEGFTRIPYPGNFPLPGETRVAVINDTNDVGAPATAPPGLYDGVFSFRLMGNQGGSWAYFGQSGGFIIKDMIRVV